MFYQHFVGSWVFGRRTSRRKTYQRFSQTDNKNRTTTDALVDRKFVVWKKGLCNIHFKELQIRNIKYFLCPKIWHTFFENFFVPKFGIHFWRQVGKIENFGKFSLSERGTGRTPNQFLVVNWDLSSPKKHHREPEPFKIRYRGSKMSFCRL